MKNYYVILTIAFAVPLVSCDVGLESVSIKNIDICKTDAKITDGNLTDIEDPKVKCFYFCIFEKLGLVANGKLMHEKVLAIHQKKETALNGDRKKRIKECTDAANQSADCEVATTFVMCLK